MGVHNKGLLEIGVQCIVALLRADALARLSGITLVVPGGYSWLYLLGSFMVVLETTREEASIFPLCCLTCPRSYWQILVGKLVRNLQQELKACP